MLGLYGKLSNGVQLPQISLGTYKIQGLETVYHTIESALLANYRSFDTAAVYKNEKDIDFALKRLYDKFQLNRKDIFLTSKLSPKDQGKGTCREAFFKSLKNLGTDYIDLYLIHWPGAQKLQPDDVRNKVLREESWNDLEQLYREGKIKAIGVSNFTVNHLKSLLETCCITPHVNQVELHPHFRQDDLTSYCIQNGICIQAYSSLGTTTKTNPLLNCPVVNGIATQIGKSNAQVLLKWAVQKGLCVIPKSTNSVHIAENIHLDFELNTDMLEKLSTLTVQRKYTWDPSIVL